MCFSPVASFGASIIIAAAGIITLKKVQSPRQIPFASIPFLFSIQQFCEGFVWLSLQTNSHWQHIPILIFMLFAQVIWPFWVPFSIYLLELDSTRKKILAGFLCMGSLLSLYLLYCFMNFKIGAHIQNMHIHYDLNFPHQYVPYLAIFYFLPTIVTPFVSSHRKMTILGSFVLISFIATKIFFSYFVISVWCFFAALVSIIIYLTLRDEVLKTSDSEV